MKCKKAPELCSNDKCEATELPKKTKVCDRCNIQPYCSSHCLRMDWPNHKETCGVKKPKAPVLMEGTEGVQGAKELFRFLKRYSYTYLDGIKNN